MYKSYKYKKLWTFIIARSACISKMLVRAVAANTAELYMDTGS